LRFFKRLSDVSSLGSDQPLVDAKSENYGNEILVTAKNVYYSSVISLQLRHHCDGAGPNPIYREFSLLEAFMFSTLKNKYLFAEISSPLPSIDS
uniref:Ovule protein n=1 Tax=Ascaris lumbricoides TaxID=6252 RepID=A0A0M3ITX0_ASCLU